MRSRNLKPGFFKNEELAEIEPLGRILFQGLWCMADREGRLEDRAKRIKVEVLPYDSCNVEKLLNALHEKNFILRYQVNGNKYIQILSFSKHQSPHMREQESTIPAPDLYDTSTIPAPDLHKSSPPDSFNLNPCTESLYADTRAAQPKKCAAKNSKSYFPPDFSISNEIMAWADKNGFDCLEEHLEAFRDLSHARGYQYADWNAAFKNAIRNDWGKIREKKNQTKNEWDELDKWAKKKDRERGKDGTSNPN